MPDSNHTLTSVLHQAFDVQHFRTWGHQLIDLLADHLQMVHHQADAPVLPYLSPEQELAFWQAHLHAGQGQPQELFSTILHHSINVHHPRYIGHQVAVPALVASLAGLISDVMSNGTGVYEMGTGANALEKVVTDLMAQTIGFQNGTGFLTSGGSLANLTAMLAARKAKAPTDVWMSGHQEKLAILVSEEAHYCIDRAARIMGLGSDGIIKIPVNERFQIRADLLNDYLQQAKDQGLMPIAVVGCACSTSTGSFDDLDALADFCAQNNLWLHVDGAHGGAAIFSAKYRSLLKGIERADSVTIDFHKMLMTPALATALIFKNEMDSYQTFSQKAQYLWESQQDAEWWNSGKRTFECTKFMMSLKVYAILKTYGVRIFEENVEHLFDQAKVFANMIQQRPHFELAITPEANIVNFRLVNLPENKQDVLNGAIRKKLVQSGKFYIVQTTLQGKLYLRTTIMNPLTTEQDLADLLNEIEYLSSILS
ncbi:MAG: pyridoxal phosphate-dependent decarboxylase family protein [Saprospiraceae bacterium]